MSARQPFVPSRPASRAAHNVELKNELTKPLPLRPSQNQSGFGSQTATQQEATSNVVADQYGLQATVATSDGSNISALLTSVNKPLNIVPFPWSSRKSFSASDEVSRSSMHSASNRKGSNASFPATSTRPASPFPAATFKAPPLPPSRLAITVGNDSRFDNSVSHANTPSGEAHILDYPGASGETRQLEEANRARILFDSGVRSQSPFSPMRTLLAPDPSMLLAGAQRMKSSTTPILEKIQESVENDTDSPPERDLVKGSLHLDGEATTFNQLRQVPKRTRGDDASDEDYGTEVKAKRWRVDPSASVNHDTGDFGVAGSGHSTPTFQRGYEASALSATVIDVDEGAKAIQTNRRHGRIAHPAPSGQTVECSGGVVLQQLFGFDLDSSANEHLQTYEDAKRRWMHCSLEEWQVGAEELMGKFGDVMDYVKDHLKAKMSLYASLHSRVADHKGTLANRDKVLKDIRESLVKHSGNVLGSGIVS
ncbi:hypothetical protein NEOLEDRAFT_475498 [Neolentinus lepideus HHB14362 ss-1]|uniref:Extracellular mutant protein 11 C-terminal domain-containing protein n=1 Tax=Neolentinus lepideus HHB14362 ss-1 TaxID=1314782 RepID=A0A165VJY4_9AGAM|nr:hypothetical protein NEOLEDRAFT_475498 [Neolentinus lepideus HHB14362 ss-1]